jgi:diguanylate cyclase (GGDEF)-like protein
MDKQSDAVVFLDEDTSLPDLTKGEAEQYWHILIVDDDPDVHSVTQFALNDLRIQNRKLKFAHAYTALEARKILLQYDEIAVILLDVVMEDDDAGLKLVNYIRKNLARNDVRIILRTGQAGYAPEMAAIRDYEINDYKNKTELTSASLYTAVTSAIRSYEQICTISANQLGLQKIINISSELMALTDLRQFAVKILNRLPTLLNIPVQGFICAPIQMMANTHNEKDKEKDSTENLITNLADNLRIIATTSEYANFTELPLSEVNSDNTKNLIEKTLFAKHNLYEVESTTLFFSNIEGSYLALYLDCGLNTVQFDRHLLDMFCSNVSVCLDNVVLSSKMHQLAFFDPLTGLSNRLQLLQYISHTLSSEQKDESILALIDIDHFAEINDALGHQFGDKLLTAVADRLRQHFSKLCNIARIGNDIFALLGSADLVIPEDILALFTGGFIIDQQLVQLSATIGLIRFEDYALNASDALKDANIALKRAKMQQRGGYFYFTHSMGVDIRKRVHMMHDLRDAFELGQLFLMYQPQIDMRTGKSVGAEALVRWKTPEGKFIPPDQFIPIAEYSGLIVDIGEWVLRTACFELTRLHQLGFTQFQMAINVSQAQFSHPFFMDSLRRALRDTKAPASSIELEITESMAMTDPEQLVKTLQQIKQLGMQISIDDFGTGFSSLSQLQKLNVDKLKIDRAFVNEVNQTGNQGSIAKMIVQLSESLHIKVIAEGVETEDQANTLLGYGCNLAQGYLYSKPLPSDEFHAWLKLNT